MSKKLRQPSEIQTKHWERLEEIIQKRFSGSHMSNAKWVKLLQVAATLSDLVPYMNYKLVYGEEVFRAHTPPYAESVESEWFSEPTIYKEVEWIEFPHTYEVARGAGLEPFIRQQSISALRERLESIASFPLEQTETGLRVLAYAEA